MAACVCECLLIHWGGPLKGNKDHLTLINDSQASIIDIHHKFVEPI